MNKSFFLNSRILFYKDSCPFCRIFIQFIERINSKLPIEKRIRLINCSLSQELGITHPLEEMYADKFTGFPFLAIDGFCISGANTQLEAETFLTTYLQEEFINREYSDLTFEKDCEFKKGIFGLGRIICK